MGQPSSLFEHIWTIARWVEGEPADRTPVTRIDAAEVLAEFLRWLHDQAPVDAPANPGRGIPFAEFEEETDIVRAGVVGDDGEALVARQMWDDALAAPGWAGGPLWLRGDLHPANVVVRDGMLAGVIDLGEMCAGDPETDLSAAWILLPAGAADRFFDAYGYADAATVTRARGWAVLRALGLIEVGQNGRRGPRAEKTQASRCRSDTVRVPTREE